MAWTNIDHTAVDRQEVSRAAFGYPVVDDLNDLNTRVTANTASMVPNTRRVNSGTGLTGGGDLTADRTLAVSYGTAAGTAAQGNDSRFTDASTKLGVLQSFGRWVITADSVRTGGATAAVTGWSALQALTGVTVDASGDFTVANAGTYEFTFGWHASYSLPLNTGFNTNCFMSDPGLTIVYGQTQGYAVQYASGSLEASATIHSGPVAIAAGAKVRCWTGFAQQVTLTGGDGFKRTFFAVRRVS